MEKHKNLLGAALYMVEAASKKDSEPRTKLAFYFSFYTFFEYSNLDIVITWIMLTCLLPYYWLFNPISSNVVLSVEQHWFLWKMY